jgi:hypothetical protein
MNYPDIEQRGIKNFITLTNLRRRAAGNWTHNPDFVCGMCYCMALLPCRLTNTIIIEL